MIYGFSPFGYEGSLVQVEVDLRRGIPAVDIVGLADSSVKESRERVRTAIKNSGFEFPTERVLMSLSPADLKKEGAGFDLAMALAVLSAKDDWPRSQDTSVLVMGELELSGKIRPVRAVYAAVQSAIKEGIKYAIVPEDCEELPEGIAVLRAGNLIDAVEQLQKIDEFESIGGDGYDYQKAKPKEEKTEPEFEEIKDWNNLDEVEDMNGLKYAMAVAAAGRHSMLVWGSPGCGKTLCLQKFSSLLPKLRSEEADSVSRIYSIAGMFRNHEKMVRRPFRQPHQTASIEGMCGGGPNCRPGEITLAHNGVLYLDEAAEFRSSVLQMLRVPLETGRVSLSRAGRTTVYPAKFQLLMAVSPCPCGNYGNPNKVCLCSARSIELYWKKFSAPLLDRIGIRFDCNKEYEAKELTDSCPMFKDWKLEDLRKKIHLAQDIQYARQGKLNNDLDAVELAKYFNATKEAEKLLGDSVVKYDWSPRANALVRKVAMTLADMNGREVGVDEAKLAIALFSPLAMELL